MWTHPEMWLRGELHGELHGGHHMDGLVQDIKLLLWFCGSMIGYWSTLFPIAVQLALWLSIVGFTRKAQKEEGTWYLRLWLNPDVNRKRIWTFNFPKEAQ